MAALFELKNLVDMMSIGTLMAYTIVAVAVIVLRYRPDDGFHGDYMALSAKKKLLSDDDDSDDEIVYCSDENPVLPTNDPPKKDSETWQRLILCPWSSKKPTEMTSQLANLLTGVSSLSSFTLANILIHSNQNVLTLVFVSVILFCTLWTWLLPVGGQNLAFKVPLVPLLPNLSIFINLYLMLKLSLATWLRFTIWMSIGSAIYIFYGWSHSLEERKNRF